MNAPLLCFHRETQRHVDPDNRGRSGVTHEGYFVDWTPSQDAGPFDLGILAVECQIYPSWLAEGRKSDGSYEKLAHWGIKLIYHTPIRPYRPLAWSKGPERRARECHWQEGASFLPVPYKPVPCWERRLLFGFSERVLRVHRFGDEAIFDALERIWNQIFRQQYEYYLRLAD